MQTPLEGKYALADNNRDGEDDLLSPEKFHIVRRSISEKLQQKLRPDISKNIFSSNSGDHNVYTAVRSAPNGLFHDR